MEIWETLLRNHAASQSTTDEVLDELLEQIQLPNIKSLPMSSILFYVVVFYQKLVITNQTFSNVIERLKPNLKRIEEQLYCDEQMKRIDCVKKYYLPEEIWSVIFGYLAEQDLLLRMCLVNKQWNKRANLSVKKIALYTFTQNLASLMPTTIIKFSQLTKLISYNRKIDGVDFTSLQNLKTLILDGPKHNNVHVLTNLTSLFLLNGQSLTLASCSSLINLTHLGLAKMKKSNIQDLKRLPNLRCLEMTGATPPEGLYDLTGLISLKITRVYPQISKLQNLNTLVVTTGSIGNDHSTTVLNLPTSLTRLTLYQPVLAVYGNLIHLNTLKLYSRGHILDETVSNLTNLNSLTVRKDHIEKNICLQLAQLTNITSLDIACKSDIHLFTAIRLTNITKLSLHECNEDYLRLAEYRVETTLLPKLIHFTLCLSTESSTDDDSENSNDDIAVYNIGKSFDAVYKDMQTIESKTPVRFRVFINDLPVFRNGVY